MRIIPNKEIKVERIDYQKDIDYLVNLLQENVLSEETIEEVNKTIQSYLKLMQEPGYIIQGGE